MSGLYDGANAIFQLGLIIFIILFVLKLVWDLVDTVGTPRDRSEEI